MDEDTFHKQMRDSWTEQTKRERTQYYNRNHFAFKTDDQLATLIREYCAKHGLTANALTIQLYKSFFHLT